MTHEILQNNSLQYAKVELIPINQKEETFYLSKMNAETFIHLYTVRPAVYDFEKHTSLAKSFPEESEYYQHLINEDRDKIDKKDFQREADGGRIKEISEYLKTEDYPFFPNTIIVNCELINDWAQFEVTEDSTVEQFFNAADKPEFLSFLQRHNDKYYLIIPLKSKSILVIDGQHRLEGLAKMDKDFRDKYELIIAFIIGYDRSVIATQFYKINYEQKPVNKSLLYQLTGEFSREITEISFMHNVVKILNELEDSPFYGRVKMLGRTPRQLSAEAKRKLSISQAFLIDSMIRFVSAKAKGTNYPPIFLRYFKNQESQIVIIRAVARFFSAVKEIKPDWEHPEQSLLSKSMAVGALLKVLNYLIPIVLQKELSNNWDRLDDLKVDSYKRFLQGLENVDFDTNGPYGKTSSEGGLSKMKNDIIMNLKYFGTFQDIQAFEVNFRTSYLQNFNKQLEKL